MEPRTGIGRSGHPEPGPEEALQIATEAYVYAYPMVLMDLTRRQMTNFAHPTGALGQGPPNTLTHATTFPDASFRDVVRPNVDTLYSIAWLDLAQGPLVLTVPEMGDRYYLLQVMDFWSDVFASLGTRTTGNGAGRFLVCGPDWSGTPPEDAEVVRSPTRWVWIVGRLQTNGPSDVPEVRRLQEGFGLAPLEGNPAAHSPDPEVDPTEAPVDAAAALTAETFFERFAAFLPDNPPHTNDQPILSRMKRLGIVPGRPYEVSQAPASVKAALDAAPRAALEQIAAHVRRTGTVVNGWQVMLSGVGTYGTDYLQRAAVALMGLGANAPDDAVYPTAYVDTQGQPLDGQHRYVLHFAPERIPPVNAFWSLTLYGEDQFLSDNPLDRYALGDRDPLSFGDDGSLDLFIQHERPAEAQVANWLPAPKGPFTLNLRLYWPEREVLDGRWRPPGLRRVG